MERLNAYDDNSLDLVTVTMGLHELPIGVIIATLREAHRVLRPGGLFVGLENRSSAIHYATSSARITASSNR